MEPILSITCNKCNHSLDGTTFTTECKHLFCETCAFKSFSDGSICPLCGFQLEQGQVNELIIGVQPLPLVANLFQSAFQNPKWESILENTMQVTKNCVMLVSYVQNQLLTAVKSSSENENQLYNQVESLKAEGSKLNLQLKNDSLAAQHRILELEHQVSLRENELHDVKTAYKNKQIKCEAWEKAYHKAKGSASSSDGGGEVQRSSIVNSGDEGGIRYYSSNVNATGGGGGGGADGGFLVSSTTATNAFPPSFPSYSGGAYGGASSCSGGGGGGGVHPAGKRLADEITRSSVDARGAGGGKEYNPSSNFSFVPNSFEHRPQHQQQGPLPSRLLKKKKETSSTTYTRQIRMVSPQILSNNNVWPRGGAEGEAGGGEGGHSYKYIDNRTNCNLEPPAYDSSRPADSNAPPQYYQYEEAQQVKQANKAQAFGYKSKQQQQQQYYQQQGAGIATDLDSVNSKTPFFDRNRK